MTRSQRHDSPFRRSQGHRRRSSSSSTLGRLGDADGLKDMSRSSSTKFIAELQNANLAHQRQLQLEIQRLRLSEQNAELESKLQELEDEVSRADISGKRKLRKLDKELEGLKKELERALERNKELEERLHHRSKLVPNNMSFGYHQPQNVVLPEARIRTNSGASASGSLGQPPIPPDTDTDIDQEAPSIIAMAELDDIPTISASGLPQSSLHTIEAESQSFPTHDIVSQLLAKIYELQDANSQITAHKETLDEKLAVASTQFEEMKRKYDFLEERVIEAEIRNHRILELEDGGTVFDEAIFAIEWPDSNSNSLKPQVGHQSLTIATELTIYFFQPDTISPATKLKRKAVGNRPRIEQYRRMSSLYGSQARSELLLDPSSAYASPPRRGIYGPANSREVTPQKSASLGVHGLLPASSKSTRLSVSPARSNASTSSKGRSRAGSFFDTEPPEDIILAMQRKLREQREAFEREQAELQQSSDEGEPSDLSLPRSDVFTRHRHHSLASEIGSQWGSPVQDSKRATSDDVSSREYHYPSEDDGFAASQLTHASHTDVTRSVSVFPLKPSSEDKAQLYQDDDGEDDLSALMPSGPADAQTYDDLQAALQDVAVRWEDDLLNPNHRSMKRITGPEMARSGSSAAIPWVYEDAESDNSDNDPWKEEHSNQHAIESVEQVRLREKAEARALRRRNRLEQLARQLAQDDAGDSTTNLEHSLALVRISSNDSDNESCKSLQRSSSQESLAYEDASTTKRPGGKGTDYWPVSYKARYSPNVVAMRVQKTSQAYLNLCMLWTKFLVVLAVAVIFSIWKGPEAGLGIRSRSRRRVQGSEPGNTASRIMLRRRRS